MSDPDYLRMYLAEVHKFSTMTSVEEQRTMARFAEGDRLAANELAQANAALTAEFALAVAPAEMKPLDAIEQANLVMVNVIQACPPGDLHDELRRAIEEHFAQSPPG